MVISDYVVLKQNLPNSFAKTVKKRMSLSFRIHGYLRKNLGQQLKAEFGVNIIVLLFVNLLQKNDAMNI